MRGITQIKGSDRMRRSSDFQGGVLCVACRRLMRRSRCQCHRREVVPAIFEHDTATRSGGRAGDRSRKNRLAAVNLGTRARCASHRRGGYLAANYSICDDEDHTAGAAAGGDDSGARSISQTKSGNQSHRIGRAI